MRRTKHLAPSHPESDAYLKDQIQFYKPQYSHYKILLGQSGNPFRGVLKFSNHRPIFPTRELKRQSFMTFSGPVPGPLHAYARYSYRASHYMPSGRAIPMRPAGFAGPRGGRRLSAPISACPVRSIRAQLIQCRTKRSGAFCLARKAACCQNLQHCIEATGTPSESHMQRRRPGGPLHKQAEAASLLRSGCERIASH